MSELFIEQIRHELTWRLRQKVLYPQQKLTEMSLDEDINGMHFGAFLNGDLVAIVSLFKKGDDFQLRKFAVEPTAQNGGIGSKVLDFITDFASNEGGKRIWCNARSTAIPFYIKHGFSPTGTLFSNADGIDYEILEKQLSALNL